MRVVSELRTVSEFSAVNCAPGGGRAERISVPIHHVEIELPDSDLDAIIVTGDLQFYDRDDVPEEDRALMGYVVAEELSAMSEVGLIPPASKTGVLLVGDFYADPCLLRRGGSGDVEEIWREFSDRFRWVCGVAGNHDLFEGQAEFPSSFRRRENIHALHAESVELDGLRIGGISGIMGNKRRIWRYDNAELDQAASSLLSSPLDCLLLHQGPIGPRKGMRGSGAVNEAIRAAEYNPSLIAFGHCHWNYPLDNQDQIDLINSDARVFLLTRKGVSISL